jgi:hypothetical protein
VEFPPSSSGTQISNLSAGWAVHIQKFSSAGGFIKAPGFTAKSAAPSFTRYGALFEQTRIHPRFKTNYFLFIILQVAMRKSSSASI